MTFFGGPGGIAIQSNGGSPQTAAEINFSGNFSVTYNGNVPTIDYTGAAPSGLQNYEVAYNPANYGAVGDGVTDDSTAIQNCVNAAIAAGANTIGLFKMYAISKTIGVPTTDFRIPYIASVSSNILTFSLPHHAKDGDPIMFQGAVPTGISTGHVYYMGQTGNTSGSVVAGLYDTPAHARAGGNTGLVTISSNVTTTGSINSGSATLTVAAELNDQLGTNVIIAGASGASGGFYITGGVGTGTLTLNTTSNATVTNATVTYVSWIDWRYYRDGLKIVASPGAGLKKHPSFNTANGSACLNVAIGSGIQLIGITFEGLSNMFVPDGATATTTNGLNTFTINGNTDWVRPGMGITIDGVTGTVRIRSISGNNAVATANLVGTVTNGLIGQQITSGVIGITATGTSGQNTVTVSTTNGLANGISVIFDTISGTYTITNISGNTVTLNTTLSGNITNQLLIFSSDAGDDGVRLGSCHNMLVQHCTFKHFGDSAFRIQTNVADYSAEQPNGDVNAGVNTGQCLFIKNYLYNCYQTSTTTNDYVHGGAIDIWFHGNIFDHHRGSVKFASRTPGARNLWLTNNTIKGSNNHGFELDSYSDVKIVGNELKDIYNQGIFMIPNNGTGGSFGAGIVGFAFDGLLIQGNVFDNVGLLNSAVACVRIDMDKFSDGTLFDYPGVTIRDNIVKNISNTSHVGFNFVSGSLYNLDISRNDFQNYQGLNPIKIVLRSSTVSGFTNAFTIRHNKINMNNASATGIWVQGTTGVNQLNEVNIDDNFFSGTCTRALILDNVNNVTFRRNRTSGNFSGTWYLTNNDTVNNFVWADNVLETTNTFGASLGGITSLYMYGNVHKIATGTSTISLANSCTNVWYVNNKDIGGTPNFRQIPVGTKSLNSTLRQEEGTAIPTTGTWTQGSVVDVTNASISGGISRYYCTVSGTSDASVSGSPTATTDGATNTVTFSSLAAIAVGCWINIAGAWTGARQVTSLNFSNNTGVVSGAIPAQVTTAAITYVAPTFVRGAILPDGWSTFSNANYTALTTDRVISQTGTLSAARAVTLPLAANVPAGYTIVIQDVSGTPTAPNAIQVARSGSDLINGSSSTRNAIQTPYGRETYISDGSSNWTTPNFGVTSRVTFSDANYSATVSDRQIAQIGTLSASRTVTLPAANSVPPGAIIIVVDESGSVTATNTIVVSRQGSDGIHGLATVYISKPYGSLGFESNGSNKWNIVDAFGSATISKTSAYTVTPSDNVVVVDATSGAVTITLPSAVNLIGQDFTVKKTDSSGNAVTIATTSAQTIDNASTYVISTRYQSATVVSDGSNWWIK